MAWRSIITKISSHEPELSSLRSVLVRAYSTFPRVGVVGAGGGRQAIFWQSKFRSSYVRCFARRVRDRKDVNDPETVIRMFQSQPSLHSNASALSEYIKALVKVDRLDQSGLIRTLQRYGNASASKEVEIFGGLSAFKNLGKPTKDCVPGTASAPIHTTSTIRTHFKEKLWSSL